MEHFGALKSASLSCIGALKERTFSVGYSVIFEKNH